MTKKQIEAAAIRLMSSATLMSINEWRSTWLTARVSEERDDQLAIGSYAIENYVE